MSFENQNIQKMIYEDEDIIFNSSKPDIILPPLPEQNESLIDFQEDLPPPPTNEELAEMEGVLATGQGKYPFLLKNQHPYSPRNLGGW